MSEKLPESNDSLEVPINGSQHLNQMVVPNNIVELLPPGSFATIENQPYDLPPFQVINCKGGRCWVRQQSWGKYIQWEVPHDRLKSA